MYELLKKEVKFTWNTEHDEAFVKIKTQWERDLELYIPNDKMRFELETDASNVGIGAVLRQSNRPVTYISRSLSGAEINYSISEKEF